MFWTEWTVMPGDTVTVVGRVEGQGAVHGNAGPYRTPPPAPRIGPVEELPLIVLRGPEPGSERTILSNLARNRLDYPEWLARFDF